MKIGFRAAAASTLVSMMAHLYLTAHWFALKFGYAAGPSLCNVNATFNCDAVAASSYSALFGAPLSLWGFALNLVLFALVALGWLEWAADPGRARRFAWALSTAGLAGAVAMAAISLLYLRTFCLVCVGLYILSLVTWAACHRLAPPPRARRLWLDLTRDIAGSWRYAAATLAVPIVALLANQMFAQNAADRVRAAGSPADIQNFVDASLAAWAAAPRLDFKAKPSLATGAEPADAKMILREFADFRCGHCRHAGATLDAFVKSHPDVRLEFYAFPLDGACNPEIKTVNRISCRLAEAVDCAERSFAKGWEMHHAVYAAQDDIDGLSTVDQIDRRLSTIAADLGMDWSKLKTCVESPAALEAMRAQSKQGTLGAVRGTPTIFADSRPLEGGQMLPVLEAAYRTLR